MIGERLTVVMGGSSGVLMSIFFTAAGQKLNRDSVAEALNTGLAQMKFYGGADEGDRTMIDALQPALTSLLAQPHNLHAAFLTPRKPEPNEPACRAKPMQVAHPI